MKRMTLSNWRKTRLVIPINAHHNGVNCACDVQEIEAIKARVKEMEEEAEKLKEMQGEVEKQMMTTTKSRKA